MKMPAWKYYLSFYQGKGKRIFIAFLLSVIQSVTILPLVILVKYVVDNVIKAKDIQSLIMIGVALLLLVVLNGLLSLWTRRRTLEISTAVSRDLREDLIKKFYSSSRSYQTKADRGKLHTMFLQDVGRIESMGEAFVSTILPSLLITIVLAVILFALNWFLFLILLGIFPLLFVTSQKLGLKLKTRVDAFRKSFEHLSKGIWFVLWMADLTLLQTAEKHEVSKQQKTLAEFRSTSIAMSWLQTAYNTVQKSLIAFSGIVVLVVGGTAIAMDSMSLGALVSFYVAARLLQSYGTPLLSAVPTIITGNESLAEVYELAGSRDRSPYVGTNRITYDGRVTLERVSFKYNLEPVLEKVSVEIGPRQMVAIVGPNGAGKSTIANLMLGFYRPDKGRLLADGRPYDELDIFHLRRQIGVIPQAPILFPGTILENITYGWSGDSLDDVIEVSRLAGSHQFISQLASGYESFIGDQGVLLSGGERQMIAICRALLHRPRFLILDEPTNHLDQNAVQHLVHNLQVNGRGLTTLIITHHWEIVREADQIYYLENRTLRNVTYEELWSLAEKPVAQKRES